MRFLSGKYDVSQMFPFFSRYRLKTSLSFTIESTVTLDPQKAQLSRNPGVFGCPHFALGAGTVLPMEGAIPGLPKPHIWAENQEHISLPPSSFSLLREHF